jgi:hypothetical protein
MFHFVKSCSLLRSFVFFWGFTQILCTICEGRCARVQTAKMKTAAKIAFFENALFDSNTNETRLDDCGTLRRRAAC